MNMFNVPINAALNSCAILFFVFLVIIYLSKKNAYNVDNLIYKKILLWNAADLIFHFAFILTGAYYKVDNTIVIYSAKLFLTFYTLFINYLCIYIIVVCNQNDKKFTTLIENKYKLIKNIISLIHLFIFIILMISPLGVKFDNTGFTSYGLGLTLCYVFMVFFIIPALIFSIKNRKVTEKKKLFPFVVCAILGIISLVLGSIFPTLCVFVVFETIVSYIMFHTIENPDMRLITELEIAKDTAEKASNAKSDFLSSMSHELRTPLNAIVGLSQMIENGDNVEEMRNDSKDIVVASRNLLEIVNGILDISKLEENKMEIVEASYNPVEVFDDIAKLNTTRIGSKEIELRCNYSPNLPRELYGDKEKLKQIINNLLSNAIKYTEKGYVDFIVECTNEKERSILKIIVSDTGRGIDPQEMDNLFTKFYRLKEDMDSDIGGTGLGLAITKSLVELFNGKIEVESTVGVGSKFIVTISQKLTTAVQQKPVYNIDDMNNNEIEVM